MSSISIFVKSAVAAAAEGTGLVRRILEGRSRRVAILMYHRVLHREEARRRNVQPGMYVEPGTLDVHLRLLTDFFEVLPIEELPRLLDRGEVVGKRPRCVLTFDDGWRDFRINAFPRLEEAGIPAAVFLPTDYAGGRNRFWTDRFADLLGRIDEGDRDSGSLADPLAKRLAGIKGSRRSRLEKGIGMLKELRTEDIEVALEELDRACGRRPPGDVGRDFLTWEDVRELRRSGLVTFGSHTATHRILTTLSREEVLDELTRSKDRLIAESAVDPAFVPFCYPNGNCTPAIAAMVRSCGYHLAVTTEGGWNNAEDDLFHLKRIEVHDDVARTCAMFGCRLAGLV